jgi:uncharacterized protein YegP (UPF0339 family)
MDKLQVFQDEAGEWRWRKRAPNGEIIAVSGEGFVDKGGAARAAARANSGDWELEVPPEK